ncbi:hypothetical protein JW998_11355 [candidate division KSB1 bacterium]|nr:hypothetical protein [candidate division KSB1 bacterium]
MKEKNSANEKIADFLQLVLQHRETYDSGDRGAGKLGPEYWADAPWRLDPSHKEIPLTFIARDAKDVRIDKIRVYQTDGADDTLLTEVTGPGRIDKLYWFDQSQVKIAPPADYRPGSDWPVPGKRLQLRIEYRDKDVTIHQQHLQVYIARDSLPLRHSPQWYYGDTHYHSNYTNDVKEFGNPIPDTREAALCIGLEWLIITDHSVDLQDRNPYWEGKSTKSRWDDQGEEVRRYSDDALRILQGEEVSVLGKAGRGSDTLHLLVFGDQFSRFIPGAFMNSKFIDAVLGSLRRVGARVDDVSYLFGKIHDLKHVLTGISGRGEETGVLAECHVQKQHALAFAAHPTYGAQGRHGIWEPEDLEEPIQGMEAWNTRFRRHSSEDVSPHVAGKVAKSAKTMEDRGIQKWDEMLRHRIGWDDPRFVILGGSDAHGSFNYSIGMAPSVDLRRVRPDLYRAEDNCLGKVRTVLFLPHRSDGATQAPTPAEITAAISQGSCVLTDGPIVNFYVRFAERGAKLGEIMDQLTGDGTISVDIQACSTDEFGQVQYVEFFYYFQGMEKTRETSLDFQIGNAQVVEESLPSGTGYIRLETETQSDGETFRCVTNPIWIRFADSGQRRLQVNCRKWEDYQG